MQNLIQKKIDILNKILSDLTFRVNSFSRYPARISKQKAGIFACLKFLCFFQFFNFSNHSLIFRVYYMGVTRKKLHRKKQN